MLKSKENTVSKKLGNEQAFTLIEVISVLVILGILAAVAVPKYTDMQETARTKAAQSAVAEAKARASALYAQYLMLNNGSVTAFSIAAVKDNMNADYGDFNVYLGGTGNNITITVDFVQGAAVENANGTWVSPADF